MKSRLSSGIGPMARTLGLNHLETGGLSLVYQLKEYRLIHTIEAA